MDEELKKAISGLGTAIDEKMSVANDAIKEGNKISSKLKDDVTALVDKHSSFQKQLDDLGTAQSKSFASEQAVKKSFGEVLNETLTKSADFATYLKGNSRSVTLNVKATAATQVLTPASAVQPAYAPGFFYNPARIVHAREYLASGHTESNIVYWIQEQAFNQNAAITAEGAAKPLSDFTLVAKNAAVQKIATYHQISTEMLQDVTGLTGYISDRLPNKLRYTEDAEILYGSGASGHLLGLSPGGTAYAPIASFIGSGATTMDYIVEAMLQARAQEYMANIILLNPQDLAKMIITKNSQGTYLTPNVFTGAPYMINGVPVLGNTAVPVGSFIVGDFANAAYLWDRQDLAVRFFEQDGINVQKGLVTIELSERLALGIVRPSAMITGTFAGAAIANP